MSNRECKMCLLDFDIEPDSVTFEGNLRNFMVSDKSVNITKELQCNHRQIFKKLGKGSFKNVYSFTKNGYNLVMALLTLSDDGSSSTIPISNELLKLLKRSNYMEIINKYIKIHNPDKTTCFYRHYDKSQICPDYIFMEMLRQLFVEVCIQNYIYANATEKYTVKTHFMNCFSEGTKIKIQMVSDNITDGNYHSVESIDKLNLNHFSNDYYKSIKNNVSPFEPLIRSWLDYVKANKVPYFDAMWEISNSPDLDQIQKEHIYYKNIKCTSALLNTQNNYIDFIFQQVDNDYLDNLSKCILQNFALGYFHHDLKRDNIFVNTMTKEVKLIDFGFAKRIDLEVAHIIQVFDLENIHSQLISKSSMINTSIQVNEHYFKEYLKVWQKPAVFIYYYCVRHILELYNKYSGLKKFNFNTFKDHLLETKQEPFPEVCDNPNDLNLISDLFVSLITDTSSNIGIEQDSKILFQCLLILEQLNHGGDFIKGNTNLFLDTIYLNRVLFLFGNVVSSWEKFIKDYKTIYFTLPDNMRFIFSNLISLVYMVYSIQLYKISDKFYEFN